jgi:hypothetical protein
MTVESSAQDVTYDTDSVTLKYTVPFYFLDSAHVYADLIDIASDSVTSLANGTDFTVTGAGSEDGGTLTLATTQVSGYKLHIYRTVPVTQETGYQQNSAFPAKTTETALDKLTMIAQQIASAVMNSIRYPISEYGTDGVLPIPPVRAGTVLGFNDLGVITYYPIPPNVGAGDLRYDTFVSGIDYTPDVSNTLTLSRAPSSIGNVEIHFDTEFQGPENIQSLVGNVLTFVSPIPSGFSKVYVRTGTTLSVDTITSGSVKIAASGVDDTRSFELACLNAQEIELVGTGPFFIGPVTIPSSVKSIFSKSGAIVKPNANVPTGAGFSTWITASGLSDADINGIEFQAPSATYGGLTVLLLAGCSYTTVERVKTNGSGYTGISSALGIGNRILNCRTIDWKGNGIQVSGSSLSVLDLGTEVAGCYTEGNGASSIAHGVSFIYALDFNCHHNRAKAAGTFGFEAALCEGGIFDSNQSYNSIHEGLNVEDSNHVKTIGNTARWDAGGGPGIDFGMSFFGNTRNCIGLEVIGNKVINSPSSGIAFAGSVNFGVQHSPVRDNFVFNCNAKRSNVAGGVDNLAGIMLSASLTQANPIAGNTVVDEIGALTYGIAELNFGTGFPSSNEITSNRLFGAFPGGAAFHANNGSTRTALNTTQI